MRTRLFKMLAAVVVVVTVGLLVRGAQTDPAAAADPECADSLLIIEHRGNRYTFEQLADPAFRAESDDPFVREFNPETYHAGWAGLNHHTE